jgi:hypothetical protein
VQGGRRRYWVALLSGKEYSSQAAASSGPGVAIRNSMAATTHIKYSLYVSQMAPSRPSHFYSVPIFIIPFSLSLDIGTKSIPKRIQYPIHHISATTVTDFHVR